MLIQCNISSSFHETPSLASLLPVAAVAVCFRSRRASRLAIRTAILAGRPTVEAPASIRLEPCSHRRRIWRGTLEFGPTRRPELASELRTADSGLWNFYLLEHFGCLGFVAELARLARLARPAPQSSFGRPRESVGLATSRDKLAPIALGPEYPTLGLADATPQSDQRAKAPLGHIVCHSIGAPQSSGELA